MSKPVIGLSAYRQDAQYGVWDQLTDLLCAEYATAIERSGGVPVLLPVQDRDNAEAAVERIDALAIAGGGDVDPASYGQERHAATTRIQPTRDGWELALFAAAERRDLPVLGICRGMQVMAVHAGGSLDQHLPDQLGTTAHSPDGDGYGDVEVVTQPGTIVSDVLGERTTVRCHHHQAVREHPGYTASAWADDGTLEAMEMPGKDFRLAVQWHPEAGTDMRLFEALVKHAS